MENPQEPAPDKEISPDRKADEINASKENPENDTPSLSTNDGSGVEHQHHRAADQQHDTGGPAGGQIPCGIGHKDHRHPQADHKGPGNSDIAPVHGLDSRR